MTQIDISVPKLLYGGDILFDDFRLSIPAGQCLFILGMNGVGKTTLLRHIARMQSAKVSYMGQRDTLLPWLSMRDNVCIGNRLRSGHINAADRARADTLIGAVGLDGLENARPAMLSGGMRQRVALARTLFENRPVILLDEPFSALDAISRNDMRRLCHQFLQGKTVICVTHDPLDAWILADRVVVLHHRPARIALDLALPDPAPREISASGAAIAQMMAALGGITHP